MCQPDRPPADNYDGHEQVHPHFALTPGITPIPFDSDHHALNIVLTTHLRGIYRKHGLKRCKHYGLYYAGSTWWTRVPDRDLTLLLVFEMSEADLRDGKWRLVDGEVRKVMEKYCLSGRSGVCVRYYQYWADDTTPADERAAIRREKEKENEGGVHVSFAGAAARASLAAGRVAQERRQAQAQVQMPRTRSPAVYYTAPEDRSRSPTRAHSRSSQQPMSARLRRSSSTATAPSTDSTSGGLARTDSSMLLATAATTADQNLDVPESIPIPSLPEDTGGRSHRTRTRYEEMQEHYERLWERRRVLVERQAALLAPSSPSYVPASPVSPPSPVYTPPSPTFVPPSPTPAVVLPSALSSRGEEGAHLPERDAWGSGEADLAAEADATLAADLAADTGSTALGMVRAHIAAIAEQNQSSRDVALAQEAEQEFQRLSRSGAGVRSDSVHSLHSVMGEERWDFPTWSPGARLEREVYSSAVEFWIRRTQPRRTGVPAARMV